MSLPPLGNLENQYREGLERKGWHRQDPAAENLNRTEELRRRFGEQILEEARRVARALAAQGVRPDLEIVDQYAEPHVAGRGFFPLTPMISDEAHVRARYAGWRLVQAQNLVPASMERQVEYDFSTPEVHPGYLACRGIALLTNGRMMPYDIAQNTPVVDGSSVAGPDRRADASWGEESLELAVVQEEQVRNGEYKDVWPMHEDMREDNANSHPSSPAWTFTEPGPDTQVYGQGIRSGLASLAHQYGITIS